MKLTKVWDEKIFSWTYSKTTKDTSGKEVTSSIKIFDYNKDKELNGCDGIVINGDFTEEESDEVFNQYKGDCKEAPKDKDGKEIKLKQANYDMEDGKEYSLGSVINLYKSVKEAKSSEGESNYHKSAGCYQEVGLNNEISNPFMNNMANSYQYQGLISQITNAMTRKAYMDYPNTNFMNGCSPYNMQTNDWGAIAQEISCAVDSMFGSRGFSGGIPASNFFYSNLDKIRKEGAAELSRIAAENEAKVKELEAQLAKEAETNETKTGETPESKEKAAPEKMTEKLEKAEEAKRKEVSQIAKELFVAMKGWISGTDNAKLKENIEKINKNNVVEVLALWEKNYSKDMDGESLIESINNDVYFGEKELINPIKEALAERARDMGLQDEADAFDAKIDLEYKAWFTDDSVIEEAFKQMLQSTMAIKEERGEEYLTHEEIKDIQTGKKEVKEVKEEKTEETKEVKTNTKTVSELQAKYKELEEKQEKAKTPREKEMIGYEMESIKVQIKRLEK